ncbi:hypothetical protein BGZ73_002351 [Actinomortierella ambigua]|nr:hypothetical protein BGZ73_002351 [Actinomortierella ambigua]
MKKASAGGLFANERKAKMPAATAAAAAAATPATAAGKKGPHPTPTGKRKYVRKKPLPNRKGGPGAAGQVPPGGVPGAPGAGGFGGPGGMATANAIGAGVGGVGQGGFGDPNAMAAAGAAAGGAMMGGANGVNGLGVPGGVAGAGGAAGPKAKRAPVIKANPYYQPNIKMLMDGLGHRHSQDGSSSMSANHRHQKHTAQQQQFDPILGQFMHVAKSSTVANYCQSLLRISCMHVLQSSGYDGVQANPLKVMTDCLDRYLRLLADSVKQYAEHSGRSQVSALDVVDGLADLGIDLEDLKEWTAENGGPVAPNATIPSSANGNNAIAHESSSASQGPLMPTWKGPDPSHVLKDVLYKGRERDREGRDVYEWRALPEGFVMPCTEEEQDDYAYPDNDSDEENAYQNTQQQRPSSTITTSATEASKPTRRKGPQWDPHLQPEYIPDHIPPFPGAVFPGSEGLSTGTEVSEDEEEQKADAAGAAAEAAVSASATAAQASSGAGKGTAGEQADGTQEAEASNSSTNKADTDKANDSEAKHHITNPYTHVVPFHESTLPFSPLYASISATAPLKSSTTAAASHSGSSNNLAATNPAGSALSEASRQLFQDTLYSLSDPSATAAMTTMAQTRRKNSRLATSVARSLEQPSDTLFSSFGPNAGVIDSLLKQSAPLTILSRFANLGISSQEVLAAAAAAATASTSPLNTNMEFGAGSLIESTSSSSSSAAALSSASTMTPVGAGSTTAGGATSGRGGNIPPLGMLRKNSATLSSSPLSIVTNAPPRGSAAEEMMAGHVPQRRKSSLAAVSDATLAGASSSSLDSFSGGSQETVVPVAPSSRRSSHSKAGSSYLDKNSGGAGSHYNVQSPLSPPGIVKVEKEEPSFGSVMGLSASANSIYSQSVSLGSNQSFSTSTTGAATGGTHPLATAPTAAPSSTGPIMSLSSLPMSYGMSERAAPPPSGAGLTKSLSSKDSHKQQQQQQQQRKQLQQQPPAPVPAPVPASAATTTAAPLQSPTSTGAPKIRFKFSALESLPSDHDDGGSHGSSASSTHKKERKHHKHSKHHREHREGSIESSSSHRKKRRSEYDSDGGEEGIGGGDDGAVRDKKKKKKKHKSKDRDYDRDYHHNNSNHNRHRDSSKSNGYDHDYDYGYGSSSSYGHRKTSSVSSAHGVSSTLVGGAASAALSSAAPAAAAAAAPLLPQYLPGQQAALKQQYMQMVLAGARDDSINCVCKNPHLDDGLFMVACDKCDDWFHGHCVDVRDGDVQEGSDWYCPRCQRMGYHA